MIYLDHNATTPVLSEVREALLPYLAEEWGNPSSSYRFGSMLKSKIETAREEVANLIGCHVIAAMKPGDSAHQSVRFSLGLATTAPEIATAATALQKSIAQLGGIH